MNPQPTHGGWSVAALGLLVQVGACWAGAEAADTGAAVHAAAVSVPDMAALRQEAESRWPSVIGRDRRVALFGQIEALTAEHLRVLSKAAVQANIAADAAAWARNRAAQPGLWAQERAIVAGMLLQTDMLDGALAARDPACAATLRLARTCRRVRKAEERIFGDARDNVFCFCVDALQDIAVLQAAVGGKAAAGGPRRTKPTSQKEAELYLLDWLTQLTARAKEL